MRLTLYIGSLQEFYGEYLAEGPDENGKYVLRDTYDKSIVLWGVSAESLTFNKDDLVNS